MKKIIVTSLLIVIICQYSSAQANFGVKGGLNINSTNAIQDNDLLKTRLSGNIGIFSNVKIAKSLSFQPEILFSGEGATIGNIIDDNGNNIGGGRLVFNYVNIPLLLKFAKSSKGIYGEFGPQFGILASASAKLVGESIDIKDLLTGTNISLVVGFGYNFSELLGMGVRYNAGLSNIAKDKDGYFRVSSIQIDLHYTFKKKNK